jgi:hypothetical protein
VTGSLGISQALKPGRPLNYRAEPWDADRLTFAVREFFPTKTLSAELVFGAVAREQELKIRSRMPDNGVIFSDGMEVDFLRFTAGMEATITVSAVAGQLVV